MVTAILLFAVIRPVVAGAAEGFLELHVEPVTLEIPGDRPPVKRVWKILASPPPTVIADEPFRTILQQEVDRAFQESHPWVTNIPSNWSLVGRLQMAQLATNLKFGAQGRVDDRLQGRRVIPSLPPRDGEGPAHLFYPFTYSLAVMSKLRIEASSVDPPAAGAAFKEIPLPADLRATVAAENQAAADEIVIHLRGKGRQFAAGEEERLLKVARHAFTVVRTLKALPPRPVIDTPTHDGIVRAIRSTLVPSPPVKSVKLGPDAATPGLWVLAVGDIAPIEVVKIEARYDLRSVLAPETTLDDRTKARLNARAAQIATELEKRFENDLKALRGTVLTKDGLETLKARLRAEAPDRIGEVDDPRVDGGTVILPIVIKPTVKELVGSAGIGYDAREGLTGSLGITGQNLLGWNDSLSLDVKGGADTRRADFNFGVPIPPRWLNDDRITARVSLNGLYARTDDTVLGQPRRATVVEEEYGGRLRHSLLFQPFARRGDKGEPGPQSTPLGLSEGTTLGLDLEFGWRDVSLRGVEAPVGVPLDGVTAPAVATLRIGTGFEPRDKTARRVRSVDVRLESSFEHSFTILGSDLRYDRWDVRASIDALFWLFSPRPRNDILLRYVHGYGSATDDTPLFRFLRVGGESNVRGVEEGEFVGRRLHFQQLEVGVGICSLQQIIFPRDASATAGECQAGGLDFSRAFIKVFVDHADVAERAVGRRLEPGTRGIFGGGVALELRDLPVGNQKLSLTLGYAYSPDSARHSSGTVFTQVTMPFSLR